MKMLITKKDLILLVVVLAIGVAGFFLLNSTDKGATAIIKIDGETVSEISLRGYRPHFVPWRCADDGRGHTGYG